VKVKVLVDCVGLGYDLKAEETAELKKPLADKLINFGYVEEVKSGKTKEKSEE
jgi:hypothetical protein